ncbi:MAG: ferrochelatase [Sphingomonadales bacterium]|nr:ferrochelatase [Sphingomonadales bacterium]
MDKPVDHPSVVPPRIGVLLVNLGTPDAATPGAVKKYLREFLSDRRVVELPPILWQPILRGVVLNTRPRKSAHAYRQVWTDAGSPLDAITRAQALALANSFGPDVTVDYAMRYGQPSIPDKLHALKAMGCERILIAPLYPQYSGATTGTVNDKAFETLAAMRWQPAIRTLPPYHDDPAYIHALKTSVESSLAALDFTPETLLASFHSMPQATLLNGDPYHCQCQKTARLLSEALGRDLVVSFQSKLGRAKWLGPPTEATLARLAVEGVASVAVVTPGFSADNLETLEEIEIRGRETFLAAGGRDFACLPCLNDSSPGIEMLRNLLSRELEGWA